MGYMLPRSRWRRRELRQAVRKYRYMELSLQQRRKALLSKIPDIEQTLSVVSYLQLRRKKALGEAAENEDQEDAGDDDLDEEEGGKEEGPLKTLFELDDTLFAEAEIQETGEVGLWLGVSNLIRTRKHIVDRWADRRIRCCSIRFKKRLISSPTSSGRRRRAWGRRWRI